jgi:hypothetical protein
MEQILRVVSDTKTRKDLKLYVGYSLKQCRYSNVRSKKVRSVSTLSLLQLSLRWGMKLATHFHLVLRSKNEWSYTSTPPLRLHGVVLT